MALQFRKREISCLHNVLTQVQNLEQTQELHIPEGMPGVGHIPGSWGQVLIRSKEWNGDRIRLSGGIQVWLLYTPENDGPCQTLESWIPFQTEFDLPQNCREGRIRVKSLLRSVDARPVSAGKILTRAGIGLLVQCWSPETSEIFQPEGEEEGVELLKETWPVQIFKETGEKVFALDEALSLPGSQQMPEKLLYYRLSAETTDQRVMGNKLVFRGNAVLHLLYSAEDGQIHTWDFELPFSQYVQLEESFSADAGGDVLVEVTSLELNRDAQGQLNLHAQLTGQYLITDREMLEIVADAFSPVRELDLCHTRLDIPVMLEGRQEMLRAEKMLHVPQENIVDIQILPEFPRSWQEGDTLTVEQSGVIRLLSRDSEGRLQGDSCRCEGKLPLKTSSESQLFALPAAPKLQVQGGAGETAVKTELPMMLRFSAGAGMNMVTQIQPGEERPVSENRPSLILCRAGEKSLWDLARQNGSRVNLIREANGLEGNPDPDRMLLIPVV